jgi:hypothetical protein
MRIRPRPFFPWFQVIEFGPPTCTNIAGSLPVLSPTPRCCRYSSSARPPSAGTFVGIASVSLCSSLPCKVCPSVLSQFKGSVHGTVRLLTLRSLAVGSGCTVGRYGSAFGDGGACGGWGMCSVEGDRQRHLSTHQLDCASCRPPRSSTKHGNVSSGGTGSSSAPGVGINLGIVVLPDSSSTGKL